MTKILRLAATAVFLSTLAGGAHAGMAAGGGFNSFSFAQTGPLISLGVGEGTALPYELTASFFFSNVPTGPVAFQLTLTEGLGPINVPTVVTANLANSGLCTETVLVFNCQYTTNMMLEPGENIAVGTPFTMVGTLHNNGLTIANAQDGFTAAPEPASAGLLALSLLGLVIGRRRAKS